MVRTTLIAAIPKLCLNMDMMLCMMVSKEDAHNG